MKTLIQKYWLTALVIATIFYIIYNQRRFDQDQNTATIQIVYDMGKTNAYLQVENGMLREYEDCHYEDRNFKLKHVFDYTDKDSLLIK